MGNPGSPCPCVRAAPSRTLPPGGGDGEPGFPLPLRESAALPNPPAGGGVGNPGFPHVHVSASGAAAPLPTPPRWGEEPDSLPQPGRAGFDRTYGVEGCGEAEPPRTPLSPPAAARRPGATPTARSPRAGNNRLTEGLRPSTPPRRKRAGDTVPFDRHGNTQYIHRAPWCVKIGGRAACQSPRRIHLQVIA